MESDNETTLPLPKWPEANLIVPVRVDLPWRLVGDPILTMDAPVEDETRLFEQYSGIPEGRAVGPRPPRRKMPMGDKFLIGMAVAVVVSGAGLYGMVKYGWGAGEFPESPRTLSVSQEPSRTPEQIPASEPAHGPVTASQSPREDAIVAVSRESVPRPRRSALVVPDPEPSPVTSEPEISEPAPSRSAVPPAPGPLPKPSQSESALPSDTPEDSPDPSESNDE